MTKQPQTSSGPVSSSRDWVHGAIARIEADARRSADTHLWKLALPTLEGIDVYLKDESTHPTGSLKHRLARSLFLYGLCNGHIREGAAVVEASSGSTAVSEAYFARMIGVPFYAVMPRSTSKEKVAAIEHHGGQCHFVDDGRRLYAEATELAARLGGHYVDQFTYAERATDWRGNNNIAESIFEQMQGERFPIPTWVVMSAGTGGTTATIGRYLRYKRHAIAAIGCRCRTLSLLRWICDRQSRVPLREGDAHRRDRPSACGALVRAGRDRPYGAGAGCIVARSDARSLTTPWTARGRLDRNQLHRRLPESGSDAATGRARLDCVLDLRFR